MACSRWPDGMSRPGARCRHCCWSVSPGRSPNPACGSHRTGLSTIPTVGAWFATALSVNLGLHLRYPPRPPSRGVRWAPAFTGASFGIAASIPSRDRCRPSPCARALPGSEYYGGSVPPLAGRLTVCPARSSTLAAWPRADQGWFPCSLVDRSTEEAPDSAPATSPWLPRSTSPRPSHPFADLLGSSPPAS